MQNVLLGTYLQVDTIISVYKEEKTNDFSFAIKCTDSDDEVNFRSCPMRIPQIENFDLNAYCKYIDVCEKMGNPSTLTFIMGDEFEPCQAHYILTIPDLFSGGSPAMVYMHHEIPLSTDEKIRIITKRLNKKINKNDAIIKAQEQKIKELDDLIDRLLRSINVLQESVLRISDKNDKIKCNFRPKFDQ